MSRMSLYKPIIKELPFFLIFFLLMGAGEIGWKIIYVLRGVTLSGQISLVVLLESLLIWFFFAYVWACVFLKYPKKWLKILVYFILFLMYAIQAFLRLEFGSPISPTYLRLLIETNPEETRDFITTYVHSPSISFVLKKVFIGIILALFLEYFYPKVLGRTRLRLTPVLSILASIIVALPLFAGLYSCRYYIQLLTAKSVDESPIYNIPSDPFSNSYSAVVSLLHTSNNTDSCIEITLQEMNNCSVICNEEDSLIIVLVIGESFNKYHSSLYGYSLETNPLLGEELKEQRLFLYNDVIAPSNMTSLVLKNALCCNSLGDLEPWYETPFFPTLFAAAGYDVFFWDNQKQDVAKGAVSFSVQSLLFNEDVVNTYSASNETSFTYDEELVDDFYARWTKMNPNKKNLIVFHLMGQHFDAKSRYPQIENFMYFSKDSLHYSLPFYTSSIMQKIVEYDNATRYNDYVISKINRMFSDQNMILVYFSDHADEVYDYRDQLSRDQGAITVQKLKYQYDIPFMICCSDKYIDSHPDVINRIKGSLDRPFMTDNLCHLLFHLGGVSSTYYREDRDILSNSYVCPPRIIVEGQTNYDEMKTKN